MDREQRLTRAFVDLADTLVADYDVADLLHRLAGHCVALLDAAAAGLLLSDQRGGLKVVAASSERTRVLELFQVQADEGPCLECYRTGAPVLVPDLVAVAVRWPTFAGRAASAGFRSVHAVPLRLRAETIGAMNLFGTAPGPLSPGDLEVAQALADTATIGILQERAIRQSEVLTEQLQGALNSRVIIEQAKGVLAQSGGTDMEAAFNALRGYARDTNIRLSDAAAALAGGSLDPGTVLAQRAGRQQAGLLDWYCCSRSWWPAPATHASAKDASHTGAARGIVQYLRGTSQLVAAAPGRHAGHHGPRRPRCHRQGPAG